MKPEYLLSLIDLTFNPYPNSFFCPLRLDLFMKANNMNPDQTVRE